MKHTVTFTINGEKETHMVDSHWTMLRFLRESLHLTSVKEGCGQGECGACTIIVDGEAVNACLMLAAEVNGKSVVTLEGITDNPGKLHPLQEAFINHFAVQCGFCTPGMIMAAKALIDRNPHPTDSEIVEALEGNLCRCTGYKQIIDAVRDVANRS